MTSSPAWSIGLMTGTVLDGMIDVAAIRTDGHEIHELGPWKLIPYPSDVRPLLMGAMEAACTWNFTGPEPSVFRVAEKALTQAQSAAVEAFLSEFGLDRRGVAIVGFHGQTVLHRAPASDRRGATRQLGDGESMARRLGIDVAFDFRTADMRAGGQGAPLSAAYHVALLRRLGGSAHSAVLNLGGVANVTWWGGGERVVAFDTGPANAPINDWIAGQGLGAMDRDGALALRGRVDEVRLAEWLAHPYFRAPYPKSLDRNSFSARLADGLSAADGAATLAAFVGATVSRALDALPERPDRLIVCGGGRRNPALMQAIHGRASVAAVPAESVGWRGDAIEAECFAYLAVRASRGLPISFPLTTGVPAPLTGGRLASVTVATKRR